ncbi:DUF948 domain-containing protein [Bacillus aquiflavi]|uniref:DUF948 domain-containing protein n=1 Tax=Bacillus aquiflavi TaxID=2672567 RepID=A0A6B3VUM1_9BACI|nr:DUF948 domain-containing protein [Bacillus aquiflavi]MBA4537703.1 DUF948 domain-containing protein [Bacillus aquiflavi]NEY81960.1 DUF948 domain-containing protein [Bacillus aquiflavi]UAC47583.1 DUF948 domain-containing protein [Bacillus aquiflavi]
MEIILYASIALIAIAFFILVIYLVPALKSLKLTMNSVPKTLDGLEKQLEGVTREVAELLHKTNALAEDIQQKSKDLNTVVYAVKDVGHTVQKFNQSLSTVSQSISNGMVQNKEKISQVVQWGTVLAELRNKWKKNKQEKELSKRDHIYELKRKREKAKS